MRKLLSKPSILCKTSLFRTDNVNNSSSINYHPVPRVKDNGTYTVVWILTVDACVIGTVPAPGIPLLGRWPANTRSEEPVCCGPFSKLLPWPKVRARPLDWLTRGSVAPCWWKAAARALYTSTYTPSDAYLCSIIYRYNSLYIDITPSPISPTWQV